MQTFGRLSTKATYKNSAAISQASGRTEWRFTWEALVLAKGLNKHLLIKAYI